MDREYGRETIHQSVLSEWIRKRYGDVAKKFVPNSDVSLAVLDRQLAELEAEIAAIDDPAPVSPTLAQSVRMPPEDVPATQRDSWFRQHNIIPQTHEQRNTPYGRLYVSTAMQIEIAASNARLQERYRREAAAVKKRASEAKAYKPKKPEVKLGTWRNEPGELVEDVNGALLPTVQVDDSGNLDVAQLQRLLDAFAPTRHIMPHRMAVSTSSTNDDFRSRWLMSDFQTELQNYPSFSGGDYIRGGTTFLSSPHGPTRAAEPERRGVGEGPGDPPVSVEPEEGSDHQERAEADV